MSTMQAIEQEISAIENMIVDAQQEGDLLVVEAGKAIQGAALEQLRAQIANLPDTAA